MDQRIQMDKELIAQIEMATGKDFEPVGMGAFGFPDRRGYYDRFRPPQYKGLPEPETHWSVDAM